MKKILLISFFLLASCDKAAEKLGCVDGCDIDDPTEVEIDAPPVEELPENLVACGHNLIRFPSGLVVKEKKNGKFVVLKVDHVYHNCGCSYVINSEGDVNVF